MTSRTRLRSKPCTRCGESVTTVEAEQAVTGSGMSAAPSVRWDRHTVSAGIDGGVDDQCVRPAATRTEWTLASAEDPLLVWDGQVTLTKARGMGHAMDPAGMSACSASGLYAIPQLYFDPHHPDACATCSAIVIGS